MRPGLSYAVFMTTRFAKEFDSVEALVGTPQFSRSASTVESYQEDYSVHKGHAGAVVFPTSATMVADVLGLCNELNLPVVPSGGRTGFVGGAIPLEGALVLSLDRMRTLDAVDVAAASVRVDAGVTTEEVIEHCKPHGLTWPIEMASNGSSQIGGNISTNAGGVHVVRYGMTRNWILGMKVATMDGKLLDMERNLYKNNTYWDLGQLFIGSEGTLGVVTSAVLKLAPLVTRTETLFLAVESLEKVLGTLQACRDAPFTLHAYEFIDRKFMVEVTKFLGTKSPLDVDAPYYVVLEFEVAEGEDSTSVMEWFQNVNLDGVVDGLVAQNSAQRAKIWRLRHDLAPAVYSLGPGKSLDVSVSLSQVSEFVHKLRADVLAQRPQWNFFLMGHVADGNVHTHIVAPKGLSAADQKAYFDDYESFIYSMVAEAGGSIAAEHGIGLDRRDYLKMCRTEPELMLYRSIKSLLDPKGLLNPGKVL